MFPWFIIKRLRILRELSNCACGLVNKTHLFFSCSELVSTLPKPGLTDLTRRRLGLRDDDVVLLGLTDISDVLDECSSIEGGGDDDDVSVKW